MVDSLMAFGFECSDGWFDLINNLCECIQTYTDNNKIKQPRVVQVKEKFGGLRYYVENTDSTIQGMIWFAEDLSFKICEVCGEKGKLKEIRRWYQTLCDKHAKEKKEKKRTLEREAKE